MSSVWFIALVVLIALFLANAVFAYRYLYKKTRTEGGTPPTFAKFLFPEAFFSRSVSVPSPLRLAMGFLILLGGIFFLLIVALIGTDASVSRSAFLIVFTVIGISGVYFILVGLRLMTMASDKERLLGPHNGDDAA